MIAIKEGKIGAERYFQPYISLWARATAPERVLVPDEPSGFQKTVRPVYEVVTGAAQVAAAVRDDLCGARIR